METIKSLGETKLKMRVRIGNGWSPTYDGMEGIIVNNDRNIPRGWENQTNVFVMLDRDGEEIRVPVAALIKIESETGPQRVRRETKKLFKIGEEK